MKKIILIIISFTFSLTSYAQTVLDGESEPKKFEGIDGAYKKDIRDNNPDEISNLETKRRQQSYHHVREADVMWSTKIWRVSDMREKMNQIFWVMKSGEQLENQTRYFKKYTAERKECFLTMI